METLMIVAVGMQVVGAISAGNAQAEALNQQAEMYMRQATIYGQQMDVNNMENKRRIAVEKSATAQESLARTEKLQRIIGSTVAAGAAAGISTQYGTITRLNEDSSYQASAEEAIARDNSINRIVSLNLNNAIENQNLANSALSSAEQAGQAKSGAKQAKFQGYMKAASSLFSYGMDQYTRGTVPSTYNPSTGSAGAPYSTYNDGTTIRWN